MRYESRKDCDTAGHEDCGMSRKYWLGPVCSDMRLQLKKNTFYMAGFWLACFVSECYIYSFTLQQHDEGLPFGLAISTSDLFATNNWEERREKKRTMSERRADNTCQVRNDTFSIRSLVRQTSFRIFFETFYFCFNSVWMYFNMAKHSHAHTHAHKVGRLGFLAMMINNRACAVDLKPRRRLFFRGHSKFKTNSLTHLHTHSDTR